MTHNLGFFMLQASKHYIISNNIMQLTLSDSYPKCIFRVNISDICV